MDQSGMSGCVFWEDIGRGGYLEEPSVGLGAPTTGDAPPPPLSAPPGGGAAFS